MSPAVSLCVHMHNMHNMYMHMYTKYKIQSEDPLRVQCGRLLESSSRLQYGSELGAGWRHTHVAVGVVALDGA